jgi:hypothetical protein
VSCGVVNDELEHFRAVDISRIVAGRCEELIDQNSESNRIDNRSTQQTRGIRYNGRGSVRPFRLHYDCQHIFFFWRTWPITK